MGEGKTKDDSSSEGDPKSAKPVTESQPPPLGYPYPPPYQGHPPPYPGYHPNSSYQHGPPKPPPPGYYPAAARSFVLIAPPQRSPGYKFVRVFLLVIIIILFAMTVMSLLSWLIFGSETPVFYAQSLEMTKFSLDDTGINATWKANISVRNPSHQYQVEYNYVEAALVYEDNIMDTNYVNPFQLQKRERQGITFMFRIPNAQQKNLVGAAWKKDIENDRRDKGSILFDVRMIATAVYRRGDHRMKSSTLRIFCGDLEVVFTSPHDTAGELNDKYRDCIILSN